MKPQQFFLRANDGARLHVAVLGKHNAPPLVLTHGFLLDHTMWLDVGAELAGEWRVILPDLRGHGLSDAKSDDVTMSLLANDHACVIRAVARQERVIVGGHSMGGIVAMELVRQSPNVARGLILCGARPNAETEAGKARWHELIEIAMDSGPAPVVEAFRPFVFGPSFAQENGVRWFERMANISVAGLVGSARALSDRPDQWETLRAHPNPSLLLFGGFDKATPPELGIEMKASMRRARLEVFPESGHVPPVENARETVQAIRTFLKRI